MTAATVERPAEVMTSGPLVSLVAFFEDFSPEVMNRVDIIYADDATFADPINKATGPDQIRAVFEDLFKQFKNVSARVVDSHGDNRSGLIRWRMYYRFRGKDFEIPGVTHVKFDEEGRVTSQEDFWDASFPVYGLFPPLGSFMRAIRKLIQVKH